MAYENLLYETRDGIAFITFNRPKVLNALNRKTVEELRDALVAARDDASVRVLILTGGGEKSFVAGADISELAQQTPVNGKEFSLFGQGVMRLLDSLGQQNSQARPAGSEARNHSWLRRNAALVAALRQRRCARVVPHWRDDFRRRGAAYRTREPHL